MFRESNQRLPAARCGQSFFCPLPNFIPYQSAPPPPPHHDPKRTPRHTCRPSALSHPPTVPPDPPRQHSDDPSQRSDRRPRLSRHPTLLQPMPCILGPEILPSRSAVATAPAYPHANHPLPLTRLRPPRPTAPRTLDAGNTHPGTSSAASEPRSSPCGPERSHHPP